MMDFKVRTLISGDPKNKMPSPSAAIAVESNLN
jgi:hypothetical protein